MLRAPNLLTVPGDPIVGLLLAGAFSEHPVDPPRLIWAGLASVLFYCAGLVHNDLCDLDEDRWDRPDRPLPSGRITPGAARVAVVVFVAAALAASALACLTALWIGAALLTSILAYNHLTKRVGLLGSINMGLCRGLSLILGAAALGWSGVARPMVLVCAAMLTVYTASITRIASVETRAGAAVPGRMAPPIIAAIWLIAVNVHFRLGPLATVAIPAVQIVAIQWTWRIGRTLAGRPEPAAVQNAVGRLIRLLLPVQASIVASAGMFPDKWWGIVAFAGLLAAWPAAGILARRFYAS